MTTKLSHDQSLLLYTQGRLPHCERAVYNKVLKQNPQPSLLINKKPYKCHCDSCFDCLQQTKCAQESFDLLLSSTSIKATITMATAMTLPDSTALYPTLSHSTMTLPDSTALYPTLSHSTMALLNSTALYPTLSHFTMAPHDSTALYPTLSHSTMALLTKDKLHVMITCERILDGKSKGH